MATIQDLSALSSGSTFGASTNQTIVVSNQPTVGAGCVPCNEGTVCEILPTNAVNLDLSRMKTSDNVVRFRYSSLLAEDPTLDRIIVFYPGLYNFEWDENNPRVIVEFPQPIAGGNDDPDGTTVNTVATGEFMAEFNTRSIMGGAMIGSWKEQHNSDLYPVLDGLTYTAFFLPPDPSDSVETRESLSPLCDFCVSSNNGANVTHAFDTNIPLTWRNGLVIFWPGVAGGSTFTLDICFVSNGIPNTQQATWESQNV